MPRRRTLLIFGLGSLLAGSAILAWPVYKLADPLMVPPGVQGDRLVLAKSERSLTLLRAGRPLKSYAVSLGSGTGRTVRGGDQGCTPEGSYRIVGRQAESGFHRMLHAGHPGPFAGAAGGDIAIHGLPEGLGWLGPLHRLAAWPDGCIAVTDGEIEELWRSVPDGARVEIVP